MSVPVALADNAQRELSYAERTGSLDVILLSNKEHQVIAGNGQAARGSFDTCGFKVDELFLSNGESYSGSLLSSMPEGWGKYVWSDGCVYEGEWRRGMKNGSGKIQWPSGAVYEGAFLGGYMHGTGTYIGPNKVVYEGRWSLNLKHGLGCQTYPNGDVFEGFWAQGVTEGLGKYTWANGNIYLGNMKGGKMSGKGTLTWTNGDSFEGSWLDGMMHGFGVYSWKDGGCYVGTWTRGLKDGKGTFYPKGSRFLAMQELHLDVLRKRRLFPDLKRQNNASHIRHASLDIRDVKVAEKRLLCHGSSDKLPKGNLLNLDQSQSNNVSLQRRWSLEVSIEKLIGHDFSLSSGESGLESDENKTDTNPPILEREYMQGVLISEVVLDNSFLSPRARRRQKKHAREVNKPGKTIIKGHRNYEVMLSLQLGIRYTVGKITPIQRREVRESDFGPRASFWMHFPRRGSQLTPPHRSEDFKWKDYCPMVFRNLRELFKIDAADYMMSICGNDALRELSSPGKSGSVFFVSHDDRFMFKTLRNSEVKVLLRMLPEYHHHVRTYENTLITKFFGLHRINPSSGQKFRFVVMGNMFCTSLRIHRRFDLKGSSLGRSSDNIEIDENTTLKDLDLNYCFYMEPSWREALLRQIEIDSKFLETQHIMDYSLLLGIHYRAPQCFHSLISYHRTLSADGLGILAQEDTEDDEISNYPQSLVLVPRGSDDNNITLGPHVRGRRLRASAAGDKEVDLLLPGTARLQIQLGVNMPARAEHITKEEKTQLFREVYDVVLYVGIIDILQEYNMSKKIEHAYKSFQFDSSSISSVDPILYSQRFLKFIQKVFPPSE